MGAISELHPEHVFKIPEESRSKRAIILYREFFTVLNAITVIWGSRLFQITGQLRRKDGIGAMARKEILSGVKTRASKPKT